jgi:RNA polymerase sigma factor (sigma-70 family)
MGPHELASLIDAHAAALVLFARQWCAAPEDVVQDAFLKLVGQLSPPRDAPAWLYRVVRNGAIDASRADRRRQKRETVAARPERWFHLAEAPDDLDTAAATAALAALPLEQREPIVAHLWGGLTFEQIADVAGCAASTAFRRYSAGLAALRGRLGVSCPTNPIA